MCWQMTYDNQCVKSYQLFMPLPGAMSPVSSVLNLLEQKADPSMYLMDFGKLDGDVPEILCNAEKYLVQVLNRGSHGS